MSIRASELGILLRCLAGVGGFLALGYGMLLAASLLLFPAPDPDAPLDSGLAYSTIFRHEPRYIVLNRASLARPGPTVVLLGASNTEIGFSADALGPLLPGRRIVNFGVGSANVTEVAQVVDLVFEAVPAGQRRDLTFVIGLWYGLFVDDSERWRGRPTDIELELRHYGLYRRSGERLAPVLPIRYLPYETLLLRPFLALDRMVKGSLQPLRQSIEQGGAGARDLDTIRPDAAEQRRLLAHWQAETEATGGRLTDEQFVILMHMLQRISAAGARAVLVDLPLPSWHMAQSPTFADYQKRKQRFLDGVTALEGVIYRNFQDLSGDDDFFDDVHPRPAARWKWFRTLAGILNEQQHQEGLGTMAIPGSVSLAPGLR